MTDFPAPPAGFHPTGVHGVRAEDAALNPNSGDPHPDDPTGQGFHSSVTTTDTDATATDTDTATDTPEGGARAD